ncbi:ATP synthase subunit O, mitochondrial [Phlebotomus argentipes]|uniref:ATP synthase subunit O, mitochondrial n=1 Tax=Phlebotomus argentipes TaxID=94469 RepID=UPI0028934B24|nr:ATP synthase subunit O, mitochondrial [Phlebotomus argentipes]
MAAATKLSMIARSLSTSAPVAQMVKPPVQLFGVEGRYATALYSAATKLKQLEAVEKDLVQIQAAVRGNPTVKESLSSPIAQKRDLAAALKETARQAKLADATSNLLELMAENGRLKRLDGVINAFKTIMAAHRGEVVCEVTTAKPMDDAQRKQLETALKAFLKPNETILLTSKVDPTILGGLVVSIGDKYVDMSISTKVKKYTDLISLPC